MTHFHTNNCTFGTLPLKAFPKVPANGPISSYCTLFYRWPLHITPSFLTASG